MNIRTEIKTMLEKVATQKFNDETPILEIGIDSLDLVELVVQVETKYDIEIPDKELQKIITVADIIRLFEDKFGKKK